MRWAWRLVVSAALPPLELIGSPVAATMLTDVFVSADSPALVRIELSATAAANAQMLEADAAHPPRLVIDLPGVTLGPATPHCVDGSGSIVRARAGQFSAETARVVLDMREAVPFDVRSEDRVVVVTLGGAGGGGSPQPMPVPAPAKGEAVPRKSWGKADPEGPVASAPSSRPAPSSQPAAPKATAPAPENRPNLF